MANSSSVNRDFAFNGSVQSNATGACSERRPRAERAGAFNCLAACLHNGRNMLMYVVEERKYKLYNLGIYLCYFQKKR